MSYMDEYKRWVENVKDEELSEALKKMDETQAEDASIVILRLVQVV